MKIVDPIRDQDTINELKRILSENGTRNLLLFLLGVNTGLRVSDLLKLRVCDVKNQESIQIIETKTKKTKKFPIPQKIQGFISYYQMYYLYHRMSELLSN